jgi:hypothetical protein
MINANSRRNWVAGVLLGALTASAMSCSSGDEGACGTLAGQRFQSVENQGCLGPGGTTISCRWMVSFGTDHTYYYQHSDLMESGTYSCQGGTLSAHNLGGSPLEVSFDAASGTLTWQGIAYSQ